MAYFPDLSPYTYCGNLSVRTRISLGEFSGWIDYFQHRKRRVLNIGWLDSEHEYPTGEIAPELLEKLKLLARSRIHQMCGIHECEFCPPPPKGEPRIVDMTRASSSEIWVKEREVAYAAPKLLIHYIEAHNYLPPAEFLAALGRADVPDKPFSPFG